MNSTEDSQLHILGSQLASFMTVRKRSVSVLGETQDYLERGSGVSVVFLHGFACHKANWRGVMGRFPGEGFRLIAPDVPGFCLAKLDGEKNYSPKFLINWLDEFLDALGIDQCHLVAHSTATMLGISYAAKRPKRMLGLILANLPDSMMPSAMDQGGITEGFLATLQCSSGDEWYQNVSAAFYCAPSVPKVIRDYNYNFLVRKVDAAKPFIESCLRWRPQILSQAGQIDCHVHLIAADHDIYAPRDFPIRVESNFKRFSYTEIRQCGHLSYLEKQTDFIWALNEFVMDQRTSSLGAQYCG